MHINAVPLAADCTCWQCRHWQRSYAEMVRLKGTMGSPAAL